MLSQTGVGAKLAKVDAVAESELAEQHGIQGYPTFLWFDTAVSDGEPLEYRGGRKREHFADWVARRSGPPSVELTTAAAAAEWVANHNERWQSSFEGDATSSGVADATVLALLPDASLLPAYESAARSLSHVSFHHTSDPSLYAKALSDAAALVPPGALQLPSTAGSNGPAVLLLKAHDERAVSMPSLPPRDAADGEALEAAVHELVTAHHLPLIVPFTEQYEEALSDGSSSGTEKQLLVFGTRSALSVHQAAIKATATSFRGQVTTHDRAEATRIKLRGGSMR